MSTAAVSAHPEISRSSEDWLAQHWFMTFAVIYGLWVWLPWLAPLLMHIGWSEAGRAVYSIYSLFCHQLPERSFFLFGNMPMHSLAEIRATGQNSLNPFILRKFIGNEGLGWKVAWSDRMVSFYSSVWLFALVWWPFRRKVRPLPWWGMALLLAPIILDGATHAVSDLAGIGQGFRDTNQWLLTLTSHALGNSFYVGDALGSFNSWMRLITGMLAGLGIAWFGFPHLEAPLGQS
jgi:uncharacterized membrane protein